VKVARAVWDTLDERDDGTKRVDCFDIFLRQIDFQVYLKIRKLAWSVELGFQFFCGSLWNHV
jgi:hypothetical protein